MIDKFKKFFKNRSDKLRISKVKSICKKYGIYNYNLMHKDLTVNVPQHVLLDNMDDVGLKPLTKIPLKFGKVDGDFYCSHNRLTSLEGSPHTVMGDFYCQNNRNLGTLEGGPSYVDRTFLCMNTGLKSLKGCPRGFLRINASNNHITDFHGFPEHWSGDDANFHGNPIQGIIDKVEPSSVMQPLIIGKIADLLNEMEVIRGTDIIEIRFEEVFHRLRESGEPMYADYEVPDDLEVPGYRLI